MRIRRVFWHRAAAAVAAAALALITPAAHAAAGVLIDEMFSAQMSPANFGFPTSRHEMAVDAEGDADF